MTPERRYCGSCGTYHERYAQATRDEDGIDLFAFAAMCFCGLVIWGALFVGLAVAL
jgi:hypothetical protein